MTVVLDEVGRACPLPVIALGRAMRRLPPRTQVLLRADDPVVRTDVPAWCAMVGARLLQIDQDDAGIFTVRITLP
jgi:TusA-related sulfurtransferase